MVSLGLFLLSFAAGTGCILVVAQTPFCFLPSRCGAPLFPNPVLEEAGVRFFFFFSPRCCRTRFFFVLFFFPFSSAVQLLATFPSAPFPLKSTNEALFFGVGVGKKEVTSFLFLLFLLFFGRNVRLVASSHTDVEVVTVCWRNAASTFFSSPHVGETVAPFLTPFFSTFEEQKKKPILHTVVGRWLFFSFSLRWRRSRRLLLFFSSDSWRKECKEPFFFRRSKDFFLLHLFPTSTVPALFLFPPWRLDRPKGRRGTFFALCVN